MGKVETTSAPSAKGKIIVVVFLMAGIISTFGTPLLTQLINCRPCSMSTRANI